MDECCFISENLTFCRATAVWNVSWICLECDKFGSGLPTSDYPACDEHKFQIYEYMSEDHSHRMEPSVVPWTPWHQRANPVV